MRERAAKRHERAHLSRGVSAYGPRPRASAGRAAQPLIAPDRLRRPVNSKSLDSAGEQLLSTFGRAFLGAGLFLFGLGGIITNYVVVIRYFRSGQHGSLVPLFGGARRSLVPTEAGEYHARRAGPTGEARRVVRSVLWGLRARRYMRAVVDRQGIAAAARHGVTPLEGCRSMCRAFPASNYAAPRGMSCLGTCGSAQPNTMSAHISRGGYRLMGLARG